MTFFSKYDNCTANFFILENNIVTYVKKIYRNATCTLVVKRFLNEKNAFLNN